MIRLIIGQDPYPDSQKRLDPADYPFHPAAFWQKTPPVHDVTFQRFMHLVNAQKKPLPQAAAGMTALVEHLAAQNYYFFNLYGKYPEKDEQAQPIVDFLSEKMKETGKQAAVLLVGRAAQIHLRKLLTAIPGVKIFALPHPSPRNLTSGKTWEHLDPALQKLFQIE